jgi:hypothetical protein
MIYTNQQEGDCCDVEDCAGKLRYQEPVNCSCHISPPCGACLEVLLYCPHCGEEYE